MSRLTDPVSSNPNDAKASTGPRTVRRAIEGKFVCPFCGSINARTDEPCITCNMENTPATRNSTRSRVGPWYVLQKGNPAAPGMKYETLIKFIRKGRIQPRAVMRGPTTTQLWRFAASVKGVSREFGLCYNCAGDLDPTADHCPHCGRDQSPPADPDVLLESTALPKTAPVAAVTPDALDFAEVDDLPPIGSALPGNPAAAIAKPVVGSGSERFHAVAGGLGAVLPGAGAAHGGAESVDPAVTAATEVQRLERERREIEAGRITREQTPRDPSKPSPTLSPQQLANAFQLDFSGPKKVKRRRGGKLMATMFVLIALGGGAVAAYLKLPQVKTWTDATYASASTQVQAWIKQIQSGSSAKPAGAGGVPSNLTLQAVPAPATNSPASNPLVANKSPGGVTPAPAALNTPAALTTPTPDRAPPAVIGVLVPKSPAVVSPAADTSSLTPDQAYDRSLKLWRQALDAESHSDWAGAVVYFEQIKQLPQKAWPNSLDLRLAEARGRVGG